LGLTKGEHDLFLTQPLSVCALHRIALHGRTSSRGAGGDVGHVAPVVRDSSLQILLPALEILLSLVQLLLLALQEVFYTLLWGQVEGLPYGAVEGGLCLIGLNLL
jgi:hypothetical protein